MKFLKVLRSAIFIVLNISAMNSLFAQVNLHNGIVGYYPFNGNAIDEAHQNVEGIINEAVLTEDRFGIPNSAFSFNGNSSNIELPDTYLHLDQYSYSVWALLYSLPSEGEREMVLSFGSWGGDQYINYNKNYNSIYNGWSCGGYNQNYQQFGMSQGVDPLVNQWYHLVVTRDSSNMKFYVDDVLVIADSAFSKLTPSYGTEIFRAMVGQRFNNTLTINGKIDDIRIYNRVLNVDEIHALYSEITFSGIAVSDIKAKVGDIVEIAVSTSQIQTSDNIISFQFDLSYDSSKIEYIECNLTGTIAEGGTIIINSGNSGQLRAGYMSTNALSGIGQIAKLKFKIFEPGSSPLIISNFLFNDDTISNIINGSVSTINLYGDPDANGQILAYDAALTLQYSVGLDPLPAIDPTPWESWRIESVDVDNVSGISANDASLVLQKSIGLIQYFPVENPKKIGVNSNADVELKVENNEIVFYSKGSLFGLNLNVDNSNNILGVPVLLNNNMMEAVNYQDNHLFIGLATAFSPAENTAFLKIPLLSKQILQSQFDMIVNTDAKTVFLELPSGIQVFRNDRISIYPNPVMDNLTISGISNPTIAGIYSVNGKRLQTNILTNLKNEIDVSNLLKGIYIIKFETGKEITVKKFVKN